MNRRLSFIISLFIVICFLSCDIKLVDEKSQEIVIEPVQITFDKGLKANPALSPDGTQLAYSRTDVVIPLVAYSIETGASYPFATIQDEINGNVSISRDGQWIAFDSYSRNQIIIQSAETGIEYPITPRDSACSGPQWSPDGRKICYGKADKDNDYSLWVFSLDDSSHRRVAKVAGYALIDANWFEDGENLIFRAGSWAEDNSELWSVSLTTGNIKRYSDDPIFDFNSPSISPDETKIAFISSYPDSIDWSVWIYSVPDGSIYPFSKEGYSRYPVWSPDGSKLAYSSYYDGTVITSVDNDLITSVNTVFSYVYPNWLEDNETIVISSTDKLYKTNLWTINLVTNQTHQLTDFTESEYSNRYIASAWDSKRDYIFLSQSGKNKLSFINIHTSELIDFKSGRNPEISQDGQWLTYDYGGYIFLFNLTTQETRKLEKENDDYLSEPTLSPDMSQIACMKSNNIIIFDLIDNTLVENFRLTGYWSSPAWSPENAVYGTRIAANHNNDIHLINPENLDNRTVLEYTKNPAWSIDGEKLFCIDLKDYQIYSRNIFYEITNE